MNEFETATVALQQTTFQELLSWAPLISSGSAAFAAIGIWVGVIAMIILNVRRSREASKDAKEMRRSNDQRHEEANQRHEEANQRHEEAVQRHEEVMAAHKESMAAHMTARKETMATHEEAMAARRESMAALKELIRRTSGPSAPPPAEE